MRSLILGLAVLGQGAAADVPRVVVDIAPIHSIVAAVMGDVGAPDLIVPPAASPHGYSMRISEARALDQADVVVWVGQDLSPWMIGSIESLASDARVIELLSHPSTVLLDVREGVAFGDHDDDPVRAEDADNRGTPDPHVWLDPDNAMAWANMIAEVLSDIDPGNAAVYSRNAVQFNIRINTLKAEINVIFDPVRDRPFVVFHDAYHYFERRFEIEAVGAVSDNDASPPSPARVAKLRERIEETGAVCALTEPQFNPGILAALGRARLGEIDPIGVTLTPGPDLYPQLLRNMATALAVCLK